LPSKYIDGLDPGCWKGVNARCLALELTHSGLEFAQEVDLPVVYEDLQIASGYRADFILESLVILELKALERLLPVHELQTRTYLHLSGCKVALLINFNTALLKDGIRRIIP
jgi:GxxExxY protein